MGFRFLNALDNAKALISIQWVFIGLLAVVSMYSIDGLRRAPTAIDLHIPPDLTNGAVVRPGEVGAANVYAFALTVWQQVNRWSENGQKDYGTQIFGTSAYLTPQCRDYLQTDMNTRSNRGELSGRTRALGEIPGRMFTDAKVQKIADGIWLVNLETEIQETVRGELVKHIYVRYPLRVVRYRFDAQRNQYGLALDCSTRDESPSKIDEAEINQATSQNKKPQIEAVTVNPASVLAPKSGQ